ncbi:hypothetical protein [Boseongicola aestuarii]|uniref:hypothetical protein n=1 Tax=Boseongicola aestuarii TaxID=1470561 RepID=UPI000BB4558B|nr:hypothetical protein [Boseongicola aestuarii]
MRFLRPWRDPFDQIGKRPGQRWSGEQSIGFLGHDTRSDVSPFHGRWQAKAVVGPGVFPSDLFLDVEMIMEAGCRCRCRILIWSRAKRKRAAFLRDTCGPFPDRHLIALRIDRGTVREHDLAVCRTGRTERSGLRIVNAHPMAMVATTTPSTKNRVVSSDDFTWRGATDIRFFPSV